MKDTNKGPLVTNTEEDEQLHRLIRQVLEEDGAIIPSTPDTVSCAESALERENVSIPKSLLTFAAALKITSKHRMVNCAPISAPTETEVNLARAAREGGDVPLNVEAQMRADRAAAEDLVDGKETH